MMNAEESQRWWQRDDLAYRGEELYFAGLAVSTLAKRFGSCICLFFRACS